MGFVQRDSYNSLKVEKELLKRELLNKKPSLRKRESSMEYIDTKVKEVVNKWQKEGRLVLVEEIILGLTAKKYKLSEISTKLYNMRLTAEELDVIVLNELIKKHMKDVYIFTDNEASELITLGRAIRGTYQGDSKQFDYNLSRIGDSVDKNVFNKKEVEGREVSMDFVQKVEVDKEKMGIERPTGLTRAPKADCPYCLGKGILYNSKNEVVECVCVREKK